MNKEISFPEPQKPVGNIIEERFTGGPAQPLNFQRPAPPGALAGAMNLEVHMGLTVLDTYAIEVLKAIMDKGVKITRKGLIFPDAKPVVDYAFNVALGCTAKREMILKASRASVQPKPQPDDSPKPETPPADDEPEEPKVDA